MAARMAVDATYTFTTGHKCMGCQTLFVQSFNAKRHRDATCPGAEVRAVRCAMAEVDANDNIIGAPHTKEALKAGTEAEREAILQTILENPVVRAATTCPYNAIGGIFQHTKGARGPHKLRNVHRAGRKIVELQPDGPHEFNELEYCKAEALRLVRILRHGADAVSGDPGAARHLKEWAADVLKMLTAGTPSTYGERLEQYCRKDAKFYKLPEASRQEVMTAVRNIGPLIVKKNKNGVHRLGTPADGSTVLATDQKTMSVAVQTTVCTCGRWKANEQETREEHTHEENDQENDRAYLYLVRNGAAGDGVSKIGRWTRSPAKLLARYRTYYLHPRIWAVQVPAAAVNDLEKVLKDVAAYRDLNADKKRKRELVLDCEAMEEAFVTIAAHGDRRKIVVLEC